MYQNISLCSSYFPLLVWRTNAAAGFLFTFRRQQIFSRVSRGTKKNVSFRIVLLKSQCGKYISHLRKKLIKCRGNLLARPRQSLWKFATLLRHMFEKGTWERETYANFLSRFFFGDAHKGIKLMGVRLMAASVESEITCVFGQQRNGMGNFIGSFYDVFMS